jgi:hypothetical protein
MTNADLDAEVIALDSKREPRPRLVPRAWSELSSLPKRTSLIGNLLDTTAMSIIYGASGCGKTFFILDIAVHVAFGWPWRGRKLKQGTVVYIAAEGGLGIAERLTAFRLHHNIEVEGVPLHIIAEPVDLCRSTDDVALLIQRCEALSPVVLIVIDTLSRVMAGGNENAPDDMGKFVANCDRLRLATGAHLMVIHHSGKDDARGARGHSLLKAAADTEIEVTNDEASGIAMATVAKQRDHRIGDAFAFRLVPIEIGRDEDGDPVLSCIVETVDAPAGRPARKAARLPPAAQTALRALTEAIADEGVPPTSGRIPRGVRVITVESWRKSAYRMGISASDEQEAKRKAFQRASDQLIGASRVGFLDGMVWMP